MADDATIFLVGAGHKTGHVHEGDNRNVEGVTRANKPCGLFRGVNVQDTGQNLGLIAHESHRVAVDSSKPASDLWRVGGVYFQVLAVIHHRRDELFHVVGLVR